MPTSQKRARLIDLLSGFSVTGGGVQLQAGGAASGGFVHAYVPETTFTVTGATNANPIVITTDKPHGLATGAKVFVQGVTGINNLANNTVGANQAWTIQNEPGTAKNISAATNASPIVVTSTAHGFLNSDIVQVSGVIGNTAANGYWTVKNKTTDTFELWTVDATPVVSVGNGTWTSGGAIVYANKFSFGVNGSGQPAWGGGGTVQVFQPIWQTRDKATAWSNSIVALDGSGRPTAPVFGDGVYRLAVYSSTLGHQYDVENAEYSGYGVVVSVKDFGARGDAVLASPQNVWTGTDDTAALQAAIDWALSYNGSSPTPNAMARVHFPAGAYLISSSLLVRYFSSGQYQAVCMELYGDHRAFNVGQSLIYQRASYIVQRSNAVPAMCIQAAAGVSVTNLGFVGQNKFPDFITNDLINDSLFVNNGCRDDMWSPYSGIVIDGYRDTRYRTITFVDSVGGAGTAFRITTLEPHGFTASQNVTISGAPALSPDPNGARQVASVVDANRFTINLNYTSGTYGGGGTVQDTNNPQPNPNVGYPGQTSLYINGAPSTAVTIQGCNFEQFVVGVCIAPTAFGGQTENIYIKDTGFTQHKVAVAVCQNQSRNCVLDNVAAGNQLFFVSTRSYGNGGPYYSSAVPPAIHKCSVDNTKYVFNVDVGFQTLHVSGLYGEGVLSLGYIGNSPDKVTGATNFGATFSGCSVNFHTRTSSGVPIKTIDFHLFNYAPVEFRGSSLGSADGIAPLLFCNFGPVTFADTWLHSYKQPVGTFALAFQNPGVVRFENARVCDNSLENKFALLNGDYDTSVTSGPTAFVDRQPLPSPEYAREGTRVRVMGTQLKTLAVNADATTTLTQGSDGQATFTATTPGCFQPGDLVHLKKVGTADGFRPEWYNLQGAKQSGGTLYDLSNVIAGAVDSVSGTTVTLKYVPQTVWGLLNASTKLQVKYLARYHRLTYGSLTNASSTISSVTPDPSGTYGYWKAGDRIDHPSLPPGTYVTSNSTANQLSVSNYATATVSTTPLVDADTVTHVFDGSRDATVAALQTSLYPFARKLLWETKPLYSTSDTPTRIYATGGALEITVNARWDGTNWNQDLYTGWSSCKLAVGSATLHYYVKQPTGGTAWSDSSWSSDWGVSPPTTGTQSFGSSGTWTSAGAIDCVMGAETMQNSSSGYLGTGTTFPKVFPATPTSFTWTWLDSGHISGGPNIWKQQPFGACGFCTTNATGDCWWYYKLTVS